jgi:hypothetical protein
MKFLRLSAAISTIVLSLVPCFHTSANALEPDYPCFMTTPSGKVLDLSESLCGTKKSAPEVSANIGQPSRKYKKRYVPEEALRRKALRLIQSSEENVPVVTDTYIPR